ncbi:NAD(P)/FAD-dependent oxidoreductase [Methylolobus aquaticus]
MYHYRYLIIGGGMTADAAVRGIRQHDPDGTVGIISHEAHAPYRRPPLSKGLWLGKSPESIWLRTENLGITLHLGRAATLLDPTAHKVTDHREEVYGFDKLLLATGGEPRRLSDTDEGIIYFRTYADYLQLSQLAERHDRFAVIGGGFIGSEIAAALNQIGKHVVMAFPEDGICSRLFPAGLSRFVTDYFAQRGVSILSGCTLSHYSRVGERASLRFQQSGTTPESLIEADAVIAGLGILPGVVLAEKAGLRTDNGIVVDECLRTSASDIYAAGDVANFYNPLLGERLRVEHEDNALTMGRMAGANMAGAAERYDHLPFFYSDLFDLGYEAVGRLDATAETVEDWIQPYRKGVVYYLRDGRVRGVLLWNVWERVPAARSLIAEPGPFSAADLKGRL